MAPKIKATYEAQADIPEQYIDLFEERQGKWILQRDAIEGIDTEANVQRLTTANTKLRAELTGAKDKLLLFGDVKPEEVHMLTQQLEETKAALDLAGQPNEEKINNLVETRIKGRLAPLERELTTTKTSLDTITKDRDKLNTQIITGQIAEAVRTAATSAKVITEAIPDVIDLTKNIFEIVDVDGTGKTRVLTKDGVGVTPGLEPDAYFAEVGPKKPHWFAGSQGAGANGGRRQPGYSSDNPWAPENWNLTKQGQIVKEKGQSEAERLAKMAGSHIGATRPTVRKPASV